ncbi:MAG TPA: disulfide bond formation protein B [Acidimicrobiia bacterium]
MSTDTLSRFFASLALFTFAATVAVIALVITSRLRPESSAAAFLDDIAANSLWLGMVVAAVTTAGSLYYSLGAHFTPCELCWYQRICVYPLSVVLLIAALRRDFGVWRYGLPPALVGIVIAAYHTQLQAFPSQSTFCSLTNPCTIRYVWQFGFVSLPLMDLAALTFITAMLMLAREHERQLHTTITLGATPS